MSSKLPLIQLEGVDVMYDARSRYVLKNVNLTIYDKDFLGIIGPNGGGKTTLSKTILGLIKPTAGRIRFFMNGKEVRSINAGYLPQYTQIDKQFPISVYDVILSGLSKQKSLFRPYTKEHHERVSEIVAQMELQGLEQRSIGTLSGGQIQRVLLGRAIVSKPDVVFLDEPNTYIDKHFEGILYRLLKKINEDCAIVLVSHDIGTVLQNVKTIACVNGEVCYHPDTQISAKELEAYFDCPLELIGHGGLPHRMLGYHGSTHHWNLK